MNTNDTYKNFKVISVSDLPELKAKGIFLCHAITGMEIYHIHNDDAENLFSFAFKTPPQTSSGVAHILEHSVLCGSKNYPIKDPFIQLSSQSVKTFLNAMTFPDKTVYPASSMIEADYFNLFAVYGDAVFFPLLDEKIFMQEAYHLEIDENNQQCFQGVVYNEMKGNYSNLESIANDWTYRALLEGTPYQEDSGGDPECIPELTYEQFRNFHKQFYHPSNCRLFLCGNISTEKQIDFLEEKFLKHFTKKENPCEDIPFAKPFSEPKEISVPAPCSSEDKDATALICWAISDTTDGISMMEAIFLSEILLGHDASPMNQALLECGLGEDIAPASGLETELKQGCFAVGLRGIKMQNAKKLEKIVLNVLQDIYQKGVSQDDLDAAIIALDFSNREIRRSSGPFSLILMRRALKGWLHGKHPEDTLINSRLFEQVKENLKNDKTYLQKLIKKLFIDNNHRVLLTVYPDKDYEKNFAQKTLKLIEKMNVPSETIKKNHADLQNFQQTEDNPEVIALIPHLKPSDLSSDVDCIHSDYLEQNNVPILCNKELTNGITYFLLALPVDILDSSDFSYLPLFSTI
ncbi:MAG: insulinase family protein, partial [Treponemataceae bacterium]